MLSRSSFIAVSCFLCVVFLLRFALLPLVPAEAPPAPAEVSSWTFDTAKDAKLHTLSSSQCTIAFPGLYDRIQATAENRLLAKGLISFDEVQIVPGRCMLQLLIYEGELYITDTGDHLECYVSNGRERIIATLSLIQRAIVTSPQALPNIEFALSYDDVPVRSTTDVTWGFTRKEAEDNVWVMPDYGYWSWWAVGIASFDSMSQSVRAVDVSLPWLDKFPKAVWRGTTQYAPTLRGDLIDATMNKPWADVKTVTIGHDEQNFLSLDDHCRYQYMFQTEGTSYSGRFKFLQLCNSVIVSHKLEYAEFATHLMHSSGSEQNYVEVERDWIDLEEKMLYLVQHPEEAEAIAAKSHKVFAERYLTPAAVSCYLRHMIHTWAKAQGFEAQLYVVDEISGAQKARGTPFAAFIVSFPQDRPGEYGRFASG